MLRTVGRIAGALAGLLFLGGVGVLCDLLLAALGVQWTL